MVNSELFRQIADRIEAVPGCYNQRSMFTCVFAIANNFICPDRFMLAISSGEFKDEDSVAKRLGLTEEDARIIYTNDWQPHSGLSVPEALRLIADGASVGEVSAS